MTANAEDDGYARVKAWIPEGVWIDIFTGDRYVVPAGGEEKVLLRTLESIPTLVRAGGILPLSKDEGNCVDNPKKLDVLVWSGNGNFELLEDGREYNSIEEFKTTFVAKKTKNNEKTLQSLTISSSGNFEIVPKGRNLRVLFEDIEPEIKPVVIANGKVLSLKKTITDCAAVEFEFESNVEYLISVEYEEKTEWQKFLDRTLNVLRSCEAINLDKLNLWRALEKTSCKEEFVSIVDEAEISNGLKERLKETL